MKFLRLSARLMIFFGLVLAVCPLRAEGPTPSLEEQLRRAQAAEDKASVVELCRRRLSVPGVDSASVLQTLFHAQLDTGEYPGAQRTLERLEKTAPDAAAIVAEGRGDLALAEGSDQTETSDGEESSAKVPVDGKHLDEALAAWRAALAARPANPAALLGKIADALDGAGRWDEATEAFRGSLKAAPNHPARQARLAVCLLNAGHAADADKAIQAAVRADASDDTVKAVAPMFDRLRPQLSALKKLETRIVAPEPPALATPEDTLRSLPGSPSGARLERALILYRAGAYAGALPDATHVAHATGGLSLSARLLQAQCHWELGQSKEATALGVAKIPDKRWFDDQARFDRLRTADLAPTLGGAAQVRAYTVRATILLEAEQIALALKDAQRASEVNTAQKLRLDDPEVVYAVTLLRNGRAAEALAAARRATEYAPNNPDGWAILGRVEQETRADFAAAAEHLSRALSLREEPRWLRRREACLRTIGRDAEADRDARRLTQLTPVS